MSDILERVQIARQEAIRVFLKEYATNNLAKFIVESETYLRRAIAFSNAANIFEEVDEAVKVKLLANAYKQILTGKVSADGVSLAFESMIETENIGLRDSFHNLRRHFMDAEKVKEIASSPEAVQSDRSRANQVIKHTNGIYYEAVSRADSMKAKVEKYKEGGWRPEVLVLQGGGAKGMSYAGVIEAMEDSGYLSGIKMVAGTSAGALMGLPVAMGYSADEINSIVHNGRFAQFFAESSMKFKGLMKIKNIFVKSNPKDTPHYEGDLLIDFTNNHFLPALASATGVSEKRWVRFSESSVQEYLRDIEAGRNPAISGATGSSVNQKGVPLEKIYEVAMSEFKESLRWHGRDNDLELLKFEGVPGRSVAYQAAITCIRLERPNKLEDGDIIEAFIGDIIQEKVKAVPDSVLSRINPPIKTTEEIRKLSFSQLKQLQEIYPVAGFKEFGVAATVSYMPFSLTNIVRLAGRAYERFKLGFTGKENERSLAEQDKNFTFKPIFFRSYEEKEKQRQSNMSIKKAVRASMNLPFLFKAMNLNGNRVVDGGINSNFPHWIYADRYKSREEAREKMIGFMLSTVESDIEMKAISQLIHSENSVLMDLIEAEFEEKPKHRPFATALSHPVKFFGKLFKKLVANQVEAFMVNNNSLPSMETMDNVGIINTGMIGTAQFNASKKERMVLAAQGANAFIDLTGMHSDKKLRYAMGRLVSLSTIENKLLMEQGREVNLEDPMYRLRDPEMLANCLTHDRYADWELNDLILKKEVMTKGKMPDIHFQAGLLHGF